MQQIHDYIKNKLNEEQYAAATHIDTCSLILAGAWSWKTRTLTYKIAYLMIAHGIDPKRILSVTFTNKAAKEMKERLMHLADEMKELAIKSGNNTQEEGIKKEEKESFDDFLSDLTAAPNRAIANQPALSNNDLKRVGTFHAIFLKMLKEDIDKGERGYSKSFSIYDAAESKAVVKQIIKDKKRDEEIKAKEGKGIISQYKNKGRTPNDVLHSATSEFDEKMGEIYQLYVKELIKSNALDFDDLLLLPYQLFKKNKDVLEKRQKKFDYILVDEAQDTNQIQFELIKMLAKKCNNVTLIGDDYQSIYGWRWAVMENFLNVQKYRPDLIIHKLQINYRSRPHIVEAGSHIIKKNSQQYEKNIQAHRTGTDHIISFSYGDETQEAMNTIGMIKKIKEEKNASWGDFSILYRTNSQSQVFEHTLVTESIPYKIQGGFKFFERKEIKDVVSYIKFFRNPKDNIALKRIINTPSRKIGKTTVDKVQTHADKNNISMYEIIQHIETSDIDLPNGTRKKIKSFATQIQFWSQGFPTLTPADLIHKVVNDIKYKEYLIKEEGDVKVAEEKYDNIGQLINMSHKISETGQEGLEKLLDEISLMTDISEDEEWSDSVKLMTVHSSKWLEFPAVFIVGCEENIFPLSRSTLDTKTLEEERRLMYVAITRAKDHLFISSAQSRRQRWNITYNNPSRFISEIPESLIKSYDMTAAYGGRKSKPNISEGDTVMHKLFGKGQAVEIRQNAAIIKFDNPKYGLRKIAVNVLSKA